MSDVAMNAIQVQKERMVYHIQMAEHIHKSGIAPSHFSSPQQLFVAIEYGAALGMGVMQSVFNIQVINKKPTPSAQAAVGACLRVLDGPPAYLYFNEQGTSIDFEGNPTMVLVTMKRGGEKISAKFSLADAETAGLLRNPTWQKYPRQMLEARASMFCARKAAPDILAGVYSTDEMRDVSNIQTDEAPPPVNPEAPMALPSPSEEPVPKEPIKSSVSTLADKLGGEPEVSNAKEFIETYNAPEEALKAQKEGPTKFLMTRMSKCMDTETLKKCWVEEVNSECNLNDSLDKEDERALFMFKDLMKEKILADSKMPFTVGSF